MNLQQSIQQLTRSEKLQIMEYLWKELSEDDIQFESPEWHKTSLAETELMVKEGKEELIDWNTAKTRLRKSFE